MNRRKASCLRVFAILALTLVIAGCGADARPTQRAQAPTRQVVPQIEPQRKTWEQVEIRADLLEAKVEDLERLLIKE